MVRLFICSFCFILLVACQGRNVPDDNLKEGIIPEYIKYVEQDKNLTDLQKRVKINEAEIYLERQDEE